MQIKYTLQTRIWISACLLISQAHDCNSRGEKLSGCVHASSGLSAFTGTFRTSTENVTRAPARSGSASVPRERAEVPVLEPFGLRSAIRASTLNGRNFGSCISVTPGITREWSSVHPEVMLVTGAVHTSIHTHHTHTPMCTVSVYYQMWCSEHAGVRLRYEGLYANNIRAANQSRGAGLKFLKFGRCVYLWVLWHVAFWTEGNKRWCFNILYVTLKCVGSNDMLIIVCD